jgi:HAD superfamily hydrolase (TIGR01662 family)
VTTLAEVLSAAPHVLLDFDGPVCAVFGGAVTDADVAGLLVAALGVHADQLPESVATSRDPFQTLRYAGSLGESIRVAIGDRLTAAEIEAVRTAPATPDADEAITALHRAGHTVTIVSNNSEEAVRLYLGRHGLAEHIAGVVARTSSDPAWLKPSPQPVHTAIRARRTDPASCVLIGDSVSDVEAANTAGVPCIGYANKPGKADKLSQAGAAVIVERMADLSSAARLARQPASN